jgi:hypothetical protein
MQQLRLQLLLTVYRLREIGVHAYANSVYVRTIP